MKVYTTIFTCPLLSLSLSLLVPLWQFLLDLLLVPNHGSIIQWTGNDTEFKIINPAAIITLWHQAARPPKQDHMTISELRSKLIRYCSLDIMGLVEDKTFTFKFLVDIQKYMIEHRQVLLSKISGV